MLRCKNCGHTRKEHMGANGECCHADYDGMWDCDCKKFEREEKSKWKKKK